MSTPRQADIAEVLRHGDLHILGRMLDASNATLKCAVELAGTSMECVYKPREGERPLWDFATGTLSRREVATYQVAEALGWDLVPVTVWRDDGPFGAGMCQLWFEADDVHALVDVVPADHPRPGWHTIVEAGDGYGQRVRLMHAEDPSLRRLAVFDVLVNNADRKGGHILAAAGPSGPRIAAIDHGVCLHEEDKLRTVLWGWAGEDLGGDIRDDLRAVDLSTVAGVLAEHLSRREVRALAIRLTQLGEVGTYPLPDGDWPPLPWPVM